ncbi:MAG: phage holin family protein [Clostridia bacterium]|nr:phage holin family protein [Clostridia bacterium]
MKEFWNVVQAAFAAVGGWLGYFLGGWDGLIYALIVFVVIDYITGVMCAFNDKTLSSAVGFRGICKKVLIFMLVGVGHVLDTVILGEAAVLRSAIIFFFLANEGLSITENAAHLGLPIPDALNEVLQNLHNRAGKSKPVEPADEEWKGEDSNEQSQ